MITATFSNPENQRVGQTKQVYTFPTVQAFNQALLDGMRA